MSRLRMITWWPACAIFCAANIPAGPAPTTKTVFIFCSNLAFDDIQSEPAERGFLVAGLHILAGAIHGLDDLIERHLVFAGLAERHARGVNRLHRPHGVALDAGD